MAKIDGIYAREILDSRGIPTIECALWLDTGAVVATSVPTGTSVGKYEAHELRDEDPQRMIGKGVLKAVNNVNTIIAENLVGKDPTKQTEIDQLLVDLDGTDNKSKLGANAILAASQAVMKAGAISLNVPLYYYIEQKYQLTEQLGIPSCIYTMINGGAQGADNLDIQEFQIVPASHIAYKRSMDMAVTLFQKIEEILVLKGATHSTGIVGGFTPNLYSNTDVFEILIETIKTSPYTFAQDLFFGIDVAAEQLFENGKYKLKDKQQPYSSKELLELYNKIRSLYHVFYIEDPFQEDDLESWRKITAELGETTKIVGDSFLVTNKVKTDKAIAEKNCNTLLVKPNQVGTISETIEVIQVAKDAGWQVVMSHRSGETNDDFIADFAVGVGADYAKFGPPNRGERIAKYNRFAQIDLEIRQSVEENNDSTTPVDSGTVASEVSKVEATPEPVVPASVTPEPTSPENVSPVPPTQAEDEKPTTTTPPAAVTPPVAETPVTPTTPPVAATPPVTEAPPVSVTPPAEETPPAPNTPPTPAPPVTPPVTPPTTPSVPKKETNAVEVKIVEEKPNSSDTTKPVQSPQAATPIKIEPETKKGAPTEILVETPAPESKPESLPSTAEIPATPKTEEKNDEVTDQKVSDDK